MKRAWIIVLLISLSSPYAGARLGENKEQVEDRYGKPTEALESPSKAIKDSNRYTTDVYSVRVDFLDGESGFEVYRKLDESKISSAEIKRLLDANADDSKWVKKGEETVHRDWWYRKDGEAVASYDHHQNTLTVKTRDYQRAIESEK